MPYYSPFRSLTHYRTAYLPDDMTAGLSVFFVSLPLCLGIALASGAPLFAGLVAGIIGGMVVGLLSGSEVSVSGPAAGLAVIVIEAIRASGSYRAFLVAVILAGIFQLILSLVKAGRLSGFFPNSVIRGMLVGIGLVILLKQIPHALGRDNDFEGDYEFRQLADSENTLSEIYRALVTASPGAILISVAALLILIFWRKQEEKGSRFFKIVPAALLVVLVGIGLNELFRYYVPGWYLGNSNQHMVRIPILSENKSWTSIFDSPDFSALRTIRTYGIAGTLAVVASLQGLINVEAADRVDRLRRVSSTNRELAALGIGNILSGLIGGLPITSVAVRTSTNIFNNSRTRLSTMIQGFLLLISVFLAASVLNRIPLACLASILIVVGYRLANPTVFKSVYREGMSQFIPFIVTILGILFTNLLIGILVGLMVGYSFVLYTNAQSSFRVIRDGHNVLVKFQKDIYFPSKPRLKETLRSLKPGDSVLIDGRYASFIDHDIYTLLTEFAQTARTSDINYELRDVTKEKRNLRSHATI
jgi:MFS superfamily sulfate permease-like transporter